MSAQYAQAAISRVSQEPIVDLVLGKPLRRGGSGNATSRSISWSEAHRFPRRDGTTSWWPSWDGGLIERSGWAPRMSPRSVP